MGTLSSLLGNSPIQSRRRALAKTIGYRLLMVVITTAVALAVTRDPGAALKVGIATNVFKTGTYYVWERAWDRTTWGVSGGT